MDTLFDNLVVKTVGSDYSWDKQNPTQSTVSPANILSGSSYVGYAPFVSVLLSSVVQDISGDVVAYISTGDYGDYYNSYTNVQTSIITVSGTQTFCHNYVMPGKYTLTFTQTRYIATDITSCLSGNYTSYGTYTEKGTTKEPRLPFSWMWYNFFKDDYDPRTEILGSYEPRQEILTWDDCVFQGPGQVTWEQASGPALEIRNSPVSWQWKKIKPEPDPYELFTQNTSWSQLKIAGIFPRTWKQIKSYKCSGLESSQCLELVPSLSSSTTTYTLTSFLEVLEIPPNVHLQVIHTKSLEDRTSPYTVKLSPKYTRCGSFPIEKIIWDVGDGSPVIEKSRNNPTQTYDSNIKFNYIDEFNLDFSDPRNYELEYTYMRSSATGNCFYPSITAIASSTGTAGCASAIVGPIKYQSHSTAQVRLTQNYLNEKGVVYTGFVNNNASFWNRNK